MILILPYPISNNLYYRTFRNITTLSKAGRQFKDVVKLTYPKIKPISQNVELDIIIHPKLTKKGVAYSKIIDLDNSLKGILDSLIGIVYIDDKQVKKIQLQYGEAKHDGGVTIKVKEL